MMTYEEWAAWVDAAWRNIYYTYAVALMLSGQVLGYTWPAIVVFGVMVTVTVVVTNRTPST